MNYLSLIISALITISSGGNPSLRCFVISAPDAIKGADSIFVGKVVHISDPEMPGEVIAPTVISLERPITAHLTVERLYRGKEVKEVEVATMTGSLEWGADFKEGERYLVYAQKDADKQGLLRVKGCSRTRRVADAEKDLELLDGMEKVR